MLSLKTVVYEMQRRHPLEVASWRHDVMERIKFLKLKKWLGINSDDGSDDFQPEVGMDAEISGSEGI